jgi:hypothetical protein
MGGLIVFLRSHGRDESGAVTTDWVVTSSLSLLLGLAVGYVIFNIGVSTLASEIGALILTSSDIDPGVAPAIGGGGG